MMIIRIFITMIITTTPSSTTTPTTIPTNEVLILLAFHFVVPRAG
jgi:hypothetical protein